MWSAIGSALVAIFKWILGRISGSPESSPNAPLAPSEVNLSDVQKAQQADDAFILKRASAGDAAVVQQSDPFERKD